jgi:hypothetical protein
MSFTRVGYKELIECLQGGVEMACHYSPYTSYPYYMVYRDDIRKSAPSNFLETLVIVAAVW